MQIRAAATALAGLVWAAALSAQGTNGSTLATTGQLLSRGDMSLVVKSDDGKEHGPFIVTTTTQLAPGLAPGTRVTVFYHPVGDRPVADRVVPATAPAQPTPPQTGPAPDRPTGGQGGPYTEPTSYDTGSPAAGV